MLLSRKVLFKEESNPNLIILRHMGYSAAKLWNVANYQKRNYKALDMDQFPNWYEQKRSLKDHFFYKNLPSQSAQDVLQELQEAWASYFTLLKTKGIENPRPPRFKKDVTGFTFLKGAIKQLKRSVRLTIPKQLKEYLKTQGLDANYIYLKTNRFSDIQIKELKISFEKEGVTVIAVYEKTEKALIPDSGRTLSIDLGISNTFTCFDSERGTFILSGFLNRTHYYDKKIAELQSISDKEQFKRGIKYPKKTKRVLSLYQKKKNAVNDFVHKTTRYITNYCVENNISSVVIGDLRGVRKDKNFGRNNQQLHALPYSAIYQKLEYKLMLEGITLIRQKEHYTSQCSPNSPMVSKKYAQKSNRKKRGLYVDGINIYNADCVGAYNILRLYLSGINKNCPDHKNLSSPVKVTV